MGSNATASGIYSRLVRLNGIGYEVFELPSGPFFLFADDLALRMAAFEGYIDEKKLSRAIPRRRNAPISAALNFLELYLHGEKAPLPPLDLSAFTEAERAVYRSLMSVPFGRTLSYAELASRAGFAGGARFVGNCMAKNDFPVFIPCHRVIRSDGSVGNFSGGEGIKELLLGFEGSLPVKLRPVGRRTRRGRASGSAG